MQHFRGKTARGRARVGPRRDALWTDRARHGKARGTGRTRVKEKVHAQPIFRGVAREANHGKRQQGQRQPEILPEVIRRIHKVALPVRLARHGVLFRILSVGILGLGVSLALRPRPQFRLRSRHRARVGSRDGGAASCGNLKRQPHFFFR